MINSVVKLINIDILNKKGLNELYSIRLGSFYFKNTQRGLTDMKNGLEHIVVVSTNLLC